MKSYIIYLSSITFCAMISSSVTKLLYKLSKSEYLCFPFALKISNVFEKYHHPYK